MNRISIGGITIVNGDIIDATGQAGSSTQGDGNHIERARDIQDFKRIELHGPIDIEFTAGKKPSLKLIADSNLHDLISTTVKGDTLKVSVTGNFITQNWIKAYCSAPSLDSLSIQGSGDADLLGIKSDNLLINIQGSGDCYAEGKCKTLAVNIKGSGDVDCGDMKAKTAILTVDGSGDIKAHCKENLSASVSGSGDIRVKGSPDQVHKSVSGHGSVKVK